MTRGTQGQTGALDADDAPVALVEGGLLREERSAVGVRAEAEQQEVEYGLRVTELVPQLRLVGVGAPVRPELAGDRAYLGHRRQPIEERVARHREVRAVVVRRHAALVTPNQSMQRDQSSSIAARRSYATRGVEPPVSTI